ncbi:NgoBV family restriction endonuclease [Mycoplasmopsis alligatoris]|uniref:NgoBV restriction endonuclease n=1 Tax=Mycoplasmopsis alligatoris A21JP2 TaxID=747682 RepID=D4XV25_9BACT|nr:NgoBV family restriction endonuclease [Mycoplasmopsis alligatoris]EFF41821.1 NgoBV restriction endonuclease [Mycoplasmopsis alligatoris A21JP2]
MKLNSNEIFRIFKNINWINKKGKIVFNMYDITVEINTPDIVGVVIEQWIKKYFILNNIYFRQPNNSQKYPDFYLSDSDYYDLLEIKTFHYPKGPSFDVANFDSYCESIKNEPFRLNADYLIFGYDIDKLGNIIIKDIWLKKIWEITGSSNRYPLKTQLKRNVIYNIRPNTYFRLYKNVEFKNLDDFINALYLTLKLYKGNKFADLWLETFKRNKTHFKFKKN